MKTFNEIISENLINLRKNAKLTQINLGKKFGYSDKTISKWESGESVPNTETLILLADFYGVSLNDIVSENCVPSSNKKQKNTNYEINKVTISLLAVSVIWLLSTIVFVYSKIIFDVSIWIVYVWAIPESCIVLLIFNSIWGRRRLNYIIISVLIWSILAGIFLSFINYNLWIIFILGVPLQISIILWSKIKKKSN